MIVEPAKDAVDEFEPPGLRLGPTFGSEPDQQRPDPLAAIERLGQFLNELAAFVVLLTLIGLSVLGERTLPLFGGNRDLAGRVYETLFVGLGSGMLSLATPALVTGLIGRLRALFTRIEAKGAIADAILRDRALDQAQTAGFVLMALFAIAGVIAAVLVWTGQLWPGER